MAPLELIALKESGRCDLDVPEWVFDLETPGHFTRRIKWVSLTIPCVTGPYTSVSCKLELTKSSYRRSAAISDDYARADSGPDPRFVDDRKVSDAIVTSTGQNDAGLFEANLRDERYLPFEGAGAISTWRLEMPVDFKSFDYSSISDVILHLHYTARDGGAAFATKANESTTALLRDSSKSPLSRLFSLRHEFPSEWHRFVSAPQSAMNSMVIDLAGTRFPYFTRGRTITIQEATVLGASLSAPPLDLRISPGDQPSALETATSTSVGPASPGPWVFGTPGDPKSLQDVFVVLTYTI